MGWKGTVRSIGAAVRAAERESKRRQRELERQQKAYNKMLQQEQAAHEVEVYENYLDRLTSFHKESIKNINWKRVANTSPPQKPSRSNTNEQQAAHELRSYKPGVLGNVLKLGEKKRDRLAANLRQAKQQDEEVFHREVKRYKSDYTNWQDSVGFAKRILSGDIEAFGEAIQEFNAFEELNDIGSKVSIEINHPSVVEILILVNGEQVIPSEQKSLLQSGKLSTKKMPVGKYNELYQDAVCSAILRVSRDLCAMLPINGVIVTAFDTLLNSATGHLEQQPIVSAAIPRITLSQLNMEMIDPSDSLKNFIHKMDFKKTKGFAPVTRLQLTDLKSAKA